MKTPTILHKYLQPKSVSMNKAEYSTDIFSITQERIKCTNLCSQLHPYQWMSDTDLSLLTPKTPNTQYSKQCCGPFLWFTICYKHVEEFFNKVCFSGYVQMHALCGYLIQPCTFAVIDNFLKYCNFSSIAVSDGLQTLSDKPRVHSLKNQQEHQDIRNCITVFIVSPVPFNTHLLLQPF